MRAVGRATPLIHELRRQLPRNTGAALFAKVLRIAESGMYDRARDGNLARRFQFVMIGDDEFEADLLRVARLIDGGDAAINRDDDLDAFIAQRAQRIAIESVSLFDSMGHIGSHGERRCQRAQHVPENRGGHHAINVVIAVNGDLPMRAHRGADEPRRLDHSVHIPRGRKIFRCGVQEVLALLAADSSCFQHLFENGLTQRATVNRPMLTSTRRGTRLRLNPSFGGEVHRGECNAALESTEHARFFPNLRCGSTPSFGTSDLPSAPMSTDVRLCSSVPLTDRVRNLTSLSQCLTLQAAATKPSCSLALLARAKARKERFWARCPASITSRAAMCFARSTWAQS